MSLEVTFNQARQSLLSINTQFALSGRNVAGADDPNYSRVAAETITTPQNGARVISIQRGGDPVVYARMLETNSAAASDRALAEGLARLQVVVGDPADGASPAARIGALSAALVDFANTPQEVLLGNEVVAVARGLTQSLNDGAAIVADVRERADASIARAAAELEGMLDEFKSLNDRIVNGTAVGRDVTVLLDERDAMVSQISGLMGVSTVVRENNDMAIFTDSGVTLFETSPRDITFAPTLVYAPGSVGNALRIDGVPVAGPGAVMPLRSGELAGLMTLRDEVAPTLERQLDEIGRALVTNFSEPGPPAVPGLFTWAGGTVPGGFTDGIAATIAINPAFDPEVPGGDPTRLRDGNTVNFNPTGAAAFADRLRALDDGLSAPFAFDALAGLPATGGVDLFALDSVNWLEVRRSDAADQADYRDVLLRRAEEALSNTRGVNLDDEYAYQLQLERSFAASSKLIGIVDELFQTLFRDLA